MTFASSFSELFDRVCGHPLTDDSEANLFLFPFLPHQRCEIKLAGGREGGDADFRGIVFEFCMRTFFCFVFPFIFQLRDRPKSRGRRTRILTKKRNRLSRLFGPSLGYSSVSLA